MGGTMQDPKDQDIEKQGFPSWDEHNTDATSSDSDHGTPSKEYEAAKFQSITGRRSESSGEGQRPLTGAHSPDEEDDLPPLQPTPSRTHERLQPLERTLSELAACEGHDADIPSNEGYILTAEGEKVRRQSVSRRRSQAGNRRPSLAASEKSQGVLAARVASHGSSKTAVEVVDPDEVWWDGPDDPENPLNWTIKIKWINIALVSCLTFLTPLGSSAFAPGVPTLMREFGSSSTTLSEFVVSVYVLGFAAGPIVLAPLSEMFGRVPIYHICNLGYAAFSIACAEATSLNMLIVFRFCQGWFGAAPIANGGGTVADLITQRERGRALAIFSMGPMIGPIVGPIIGGFLNAAAGWRWVFWLLTIISGILTVLCLVFMRETSAVTILERKARKLRKEQNNPAIHSRLDVGLSSKDLFKRAIWRPLKLLVLSPIVCLLSIYIAVCYGILYLLFTTFTLVFQGTYHFSDTVVGLAYIAMGIGSMMGVLINGRISDRILKKRAGADGVLKPEYRLPPMVISAFGLPIGLFWYGWTAEYHCHWILPMIGTFWVGLGNIIVFLCVQAYLVDAFTVWAASALAANTILRSVVGAVLPLAGETMYDALGYGWGNSILAFVGVALLPIPILFNRYGEYLRTHYEFKDL
ncbi:MAG: hypothetical protein M1834_009329 [Cirrosporium novae-zelandiae]|nr:MAG: hypothetical protein M1834_009329 [Cirrosporium novae-zelandiae]